MWMTYNSRVRNAAEMTQIKRLPVLIALAVLVIFLYFRPAPLITAAAVPAEPQQGQNSSFTLEGKINSLSEGKLTVSTQDNIIFHVTYSDKTEIHRKDGSAGSDKDLAVGEEIKIAGELTPAGVIEAHRIDLE